MSQQINLFNPVFLKQKKYFSVTAMLQALGLIVLGSAVFYGYAAYQVAQLSKQADEMGKRYVAEQTRLANFSREYSLQQTGQKLADELKQVESQATAQDTVLNLLKSGALGNTEGYSEYMRAFARQSISGLWLTAFDIVGDGAQMSLSGAVVNPRLVPSFIQRLGRERVMHGKTFSTLQMQQPKKDGERLVPRYVEFNLRSTAIPDEAKK
jgi:Flp pilus assembly protein TadB